MKLLFNYDFKNYNPSWPTSERPSARGIILTDNKKIALVYSKKYKYYKFPGGGIHEDEDKVTALIREVQEETGLKVISDSVKEYGYIRRLQKSNYLENTIFLQDSFYYTCQVENQIVSQNLDDYEEEAEFELRFVTLEDAISTNKVYNEDPFSVVMTGRETLVLEMLLGVEPDPSVPMAQVLLEESEKLNPGPWKAHSYAVADAAKKIAAQMKAQGCEIDPDKAYVYGLLHDIGRREGVTYLRHVYAGYHFLLNMNYPKAAQICLTHSFNLQTVDDYIGKNDVSDEELQELKTLLSKVQYDDYDRLIQLLDATCGADGTMNLEDRMNDVKSRYGYYPQGKWDKNFELKAYFEKKMNKDFYQVICK